MRKAKHTDCSLGHLQDSDFVGAADPENCIPESEAISSIRNVF